MIPAIEEFGIGECVLDVAPGAAFEPAFEPHHMTRIGYRKRF